MNLNQAKEKIGITKLIGLAIIGFLCVFLLFKSCTTISSGHRGVVKKFGAVQSTILGEGLHFVNPLTDSVTQMSVKIEEFSRAESAASKDLQEISTKVTLNYNLKPESVNKIYQTIGDEDDCEEKIMSPMMSEAVKAITAKYTAAELITEREIVQLKLKEILETRLKEYDIALSQLSITDFDFSENFNASIEAKVKAEQDALKAKNELETVKFEAQKQITQAKAEAESLRLKGQQITSQLILLKQLEIQEKAIEKWQGNVPTYMVGQNPPFLGKILEVK